MAEDWRDDALCIEIGHEAFFPEKGNNGTQAKRVCLGCDVKSECLQYALDTDQRYGVWGGTDEGQRRRIRRKKRREAEQRGPELPRLLATL